MTVTCTFEQVPVLCAGFVNQGVMFTCIEEFDGNWVITLTGGY